MTVYLDKPRGGGCTLPAESLDLLITARLDCIWDTRELARRLGMTEVHLKRIERGQSNPGFGLLVRWAKAVGCEVRLSVEKEA